MTIYLDSEYRCHLAASEGMQAVETDAFNGKCQTYIEGYRFIPVGKTWTRKDGVVFFGEMISPAEDYPALAKAQTQYEADEAAHLEELGALIEEIYNEDMEVIG